MKAPSEPCDDPVAYIELLLRANREAGLAILPRHLTTLLAMLQRERGPLPNDPPKEDPQ
ncbi:hypothetical protein [Schlegelella aquatica]|uniref:hypothetical protein n=1 Tax=Caldimonas aquatica TaxID=376175 RepID=UPI003753716F